MSSSVLKQSIDSVTKAQFKPVLKKRSYFCCPFSGCSKEYRSERELEDHLMNKHMKQQKEIYILVRENVDDQADMRPPTDYYVYHSSDTDIPVIEKLAEWKNKANEGDEEADILYDEVLDLITNSCNGYDDDITSEGIKKLQKVFGNELVHIHNLEIYGIEKDEITEAGLVKMFFLDLD
jgi:hypothetical protein